MRRCTKRASPATRLQKIATTFSLATRLRLELNDAPILGGTDFLGAARTAAVAAAMERQMTQMVADVLGSIVSRRGDDALSGDDSHARQRNTGCVPNLAATRMNEVAAQFF